MPRRALPKPRVLDGSDEEGSSSPYRDWSSDDDGGQSPDSHEAASAAADEASAASDSRPWAERFPELHAAMEGAIRRLGGEGVVPKLNWSCPSDATWVNPSISLACANAEQVVLMLKSSDRIAHDLELLRRGRGGERGTPGRDEGEEADRTVGPEGAAVPPVLALRRWRRDLLPERELRCFVRAGALVGACQRDVSQRFPQLAAEEEDGRDGEGSAEASLRSMKQAINRFHSEHASSSGFPLHDCERVVRGTCITFKGGEVSVEDS